MFCRIFILCRRWDSNPHEVVLTGFFESALLKNRGRYGGTWGDKTALLSGSSSLRGTERDRKGHPVAVRLRPKLGAQQTGLRARSRRRFRRSGREARPLSPSYTNERGCFVLQNSFANAAVYAF